MSEEVKKPATNSSPRKQDVDSLLADLSLDMKASEMPKKTSGHRLRHNEKTSPNARPDEAQSLLDDLEGLVQRRRHSQRDSRGNSVTSSAPKPRSGALRPLKMEAHATSAQQASAPPDSANHATVTESQEKSEETTQTTASETESNSTDSSAIESKAWGPWGSGAPWGNLFSTATKFAGHARDEIGRRTAAISQTNAGKTGHSTDQQIYDLGAMMAKRVRGLVHDAHLDQLGQNLSEAGRKGWNDIMNAVALPVEVHDSVNVTVSHGMYRVS